MTDRAIAGLLVFLFALAAALLPGCGDNDAPPAAALQVGQVVAVQLSAPAAQPEPEPPAPTPPPAPPAPRPFEVSATGTAWTAAGAGALAGGVLTSAPALVDPYCGRTDGVAAELSIAVPPGVDCTVSLSGDLAVLRARPWVVARPGTPYNCNAQDPKTTLAADLGAGPVAVSSDLTFPGPGVSYKVRALPAKLAVRVALWGDTAVRLGAVKVAVRCADTAPDAAP